MQYAAGIITDDKRASIVTLDEEIDLHNATMSFDFLSAQRTMTTREKT